MFDGEAAEQLAVFRDGIQEIADLRQQRSVRGRRARREADERAYQTGIVPQLVAALNASRTLTARAFWPE